jgi:hypothetical protein
MNYLTLDQLAEIRLPKWPSCDIKGRTVTPQQALEIRVRTCACYFDSEEDLSESTYYSAISKPEWGPKWWLKRLPLKELISRKKQYRKEMGNLDLAYLSNLIGGASDTWCSWEGNIYYSNYLVQCKYPTSLELLKEWEVIAAAFPFLQLTCYVFTENSTESVEAIVYHIDKGKVKVSVIRFKFRAEKETHEFWTQACQAAAAQFKK